MTTFILRRNTDRNPTIAKVAAFLEALGDRCDWGVTVAPYKRTRSGEQNAYLNGVAYKLLSEATGYERDDISEFMCGAHFGWVDKKVPKTPRNPEGIESKPRRTTTTNESGKRDVLPKGEFSDYIAFVQRFGAQHGVYIPDPGE